LAALGFAPENPTFYQFYAIFDIPNKKQASLYLKAARALIVAYQLRDNIMKQKKEMKK